MINNTEDIFIALQKQKEKDFFHAIFDLDDELKSKNKEISDLTGQYLSIQQEHTILIDQLHQKEAELSRKILEVHDSALKLQYIEGEKKALNEQMVRQEEKFFEEYKVVQAEIVSLVSKLNEKEFDLKIKAEEIAALAHSIEELNREMEVKESTHRSVVENLQTEFSVQAASLKDQINAQIGMLDDQERRFLESQKQYADLISQKDTEILSMKLSKFWKLRSIYMRSKWAIFHPFKFIKKYSEQSFPALREKKVALYITSNGNYFFREILTYIQEGFSELGYSVVVKDEHDEFGGDFDWHIVVAPHEFFFIGDGWHFRDNPWPKNTIIVNLEQPHLSWFAQVEHCLPQAYAVWDINYESTQLLAQKHSRAMFVPLGYSHSIEKKNIVMQLPQNQTTEMLDVVSMVGNFHIAAFAKRPIDICFIGVLSERRDKFFAEYGSLFTKYNCYFYFWNGKQPMITGTNTSMDTTTAQGIIQRSKILINIHQGDQPYFEWHRIVNQGIANRTLVISETCTSGDEFTPGEDFISSELSDIPKHIEYYLDSKNSIQAQKIIDTAYIKFKKKYSMKNLLKVVLQKMK